MVRKFAAAERCGNNLGRKGIVMLNLGKGKFRSSGKGTVDGDEATRLTVGSNSVIPDEPTHDR